MISRETILSFLAKGFNYIQSNIQGVTFLYQVVDEGTKVCALIDEYKSEEFHAEDYKEIEFQIERKLLLNGYRDIETMFFIYSDYPERIKKFAAEEFKFWILDKISQKVIIYENQPEDYFSMRDDLEKLLSTPLQEEKRSLHKKIPFVTLALVVINLVAFLLVNLNMKTDLLYKGALYWGYVFYEKEYYRLFTSMFLHSGVEHLMNNVIILILAGNQLEATIKRWKYLLIYFVSGIGASLTSATVYMLSNKAVFSLGASGAIYGVIGALAGIMFKNRKRTGRNLGVQFFILLAFILYDGLFRSNIDVAAHGGGLIIGLLLGAILSKKAS